MTPNNNLNPLAFYKSQNDMFRARPYNYGIKYPLYMPLNRVTPFQIIRGSSESTTLTSAKIYNDRGVEVATVTSYMSVNVVTIGSSKVMQFKCGNYANLTPGQYTMRVVIGNDTYYSEVFTAYANIGKLVKVEYYNADPIIFDEGALTYDNGFKFELYLCTEIAKPEYLFEEESTKRGGFTFVENQISSKQYKMVIAAPEYLCDAIRIIRLHDHVAITKDGNAYEAYNFTPSYQWNDVGDLAQVTITFESNTVLQKISAYKGSQSVFKNALLAAASVPIMFSPNVIAQYGASVDGVAEAYTEFTGKLIRQLEEQTTLPKEAWVAIDTGTGEAKKMSIGLLGGGTGKPSELWTNDKKIKYLYIKEDNSEAYITKQFIGDSNIMAKGDIVAYQSGNYDLVTPTAGYDTLGMARFNSSDFTIDNGLVGLKVGAVGQRYYAGKGLSLASINGGTDNQFNVVFGELENTVMQGNDARFLKLYNGTWWGQAFDKSTGIVKGAMTSVDSINTLVYFNTDKSILVTKNKSAEGIKFSGGNSINGVYGSATNNLYLNYTDTTHNVKIDANHNIFANGDIVAYSSGNYDISKPLAGYDAVGMSRYDKTQFEVVNGLVRIIDGGGGSIAGVTPGTAGDFVYELASSGNNIVYNRKTFASVLDGRYVKKAGDTMTGDLTVNGVLKIANNKAIKSTSTTGNVTDILLYNYNNNLLLGAGVSKNNGSTYIYGSNIYLNTGTDNKDKLVITSKGDVRYAGKLISTVANGTAPIEVTSNTACKNLNADMVDGYHAGFANNQVALYADFPSWSTLISKGLLRSDYADAGHPTEDYLKALCKWAIKSYANRGKITLQGEIIPNSAGWLVLSLYSSAGYDATTLLPIYCSGQYNSFSGNLQLFGTENNKWRYSGAFVGNASSATKLMTARTIWGQSFNGTQNVSGSMTGVTSINGLIHLNSDKTFDVAKDKSAQWVRFSGGNSINGMTGTNAVLSSLYLNYKDASHYVKVDANDNVLATGDVVAYQSGTWDIVRPIAGKDALGMIKVGSGLSIDANGVLSSTGGGGSIAGVTPGTAGDFVYELASSGNNIVYNRKTFASVLDGRYVKKAGDTMTGDLTVNGVLKIANNKAIKSTSTTGNVTDILLYNYNNNLLLGAGVSKNNGSTYIYGSNIYLNTGTDNKDKLVITSKGDVRYAGKLISTVANGTAPIEVTSNTACKNLNADMVDGYHAGFANNQVALYADFPSWSTLISKGLLRSDYADAGHPTEDYLKALCKWAIKSYANRGKITLQGEIIPNSAGWLVLSLYSSAGYDATTLLPIYCSGQYNSFSGNLQLFGTENNKWRYSGAFVGNASSATKLMTARTIWGQSFNGTANVSGNMTDVGDIYINLDRKIIMKDTSRNNLNVLHLSNTNNLHIGYDTAAKGYSTYINSNEIYFRTSSSLIERMKIASNGNVGIGTTNPVDRLEVAGAITANDIYPRSNNSYSVGYSSRRFSNGYFTQGVYVGEANTSPNSNSSNSCIGKGYLELNATTPHIDFHYGNSTADYTHRIIAYSGHFEITPSVAIGGSCYPTNSTTCMLGTSSLRWVRLYLAGINGKLISGKTDGAIMIDSTSTSTSAYFPLYRWKTYTGRVFNLGGLQGNDNGHQFGFYMFDKDQTENRTNASFYMYSNGNMNGTHSLIMQQDVVAYGSSSYNITSPTAGYDALGLARFDSTYFTVSSGYVTLKASATSPIRSVTATTLNPGSNANASWNSSTGALSLGIPRGNTGATGKQGASVTYQWSGTSLRMGVTPYGGSTAWGSYVNLKGATGSPGPSWNGGEISNSVMINAVWAFCGLNGGGGTKFYLSQRGDNKCYFCFGNTEKNKASLSAEGNLYIAGNYSNGSDIRLKYRLDDVSNILYKIKDISAFYYIRKDLNDGIIRIGVSAQDVIKQFPEVVSNNSIDGKEYYSVEYATLGVAIAVNGLKEVHQLVQDNKNEIDLLKIEIASLKERLSKLEAA